MALDAQTLLRSVRLLGFAAAIIFVVVAVEEFTYAGDHPYAYGPAKVIGWAGIGGVAVSVAVVVLTYVASKPSAEK